MPLTRPTLPTINSRVETDITSRLTGGAALLRVMFLKILAKTIAGVSHSLHGNIQNVSTMLFVKTATGEFLESKAFERGLTRIAAVKATGQLHFTGTDGSNISAGNESTRRERARIHHRHGCQHFRRSCECKCYLFHSGRCG
jgi:uncharacterized phage protein gp47/JayE